MFRLKCACCACRACHVSGFRQFSQQYQVFLIQRLHKGPRIEAIRLLQVSCTFL